MGGNTSGLAIKVASAGGLQGRALALGIMGIEPVFSLSGRHCL